MTLSENVSGVAFSECKKVAAADGFGGEGLCMGSG